MNSNEMDVNYNDSSILFKIIGGLVDFYFFPGSTSLSIVGQYTQLVGHPAAMPYWVLGFYLSSIRIQECGAAGTVMKKYAEVKLPVESMWSDSDHMDRYMDFTLDPVNYPLEKLLPFVENLHKNYQKFIMILDPESSHQRSLYFTPIFRVTRISTFTPSASSLSMIPQYQVMVAKKLIKLLTVMAFKGVSLLTLNGAKHSCG